MYPSIFNFAVILNLVMRQILHVHITIHLRADGIVHNALYPAIIQTDSNVAVIIYPLLLWCGHALHRPVTLRLK